MSELLPKPVHPSAQAAKQATAQPARNHVKKSDILKVKPLRIHEGEKGLGLICAIEGDANGYLPEHKLVGYGVIDVAAKMTELLEQGEVSVEVCWVAWKRNKATGGRRKLISLAEIS
jgi:hypothetical protein